MTRGYFTLLFAAALVAAAALAAIIAPAAAWLVAQAGFRFPFPRIFDRVVMATMAVAMAVLAKRLRLVALLREGFRCSPASLHHAVRGLLAGACVIGALFALAFAFGAHGGPQSAKVVARLPGYLLGAVAVAVIEEGFFRAFLLGGMVDDFGATGALLLSSAVYAVAHVVRAPARFYVADFEPAAGLRNLAASLGALAHPLASAPALIGLMLLGLVLGSAFLRSGSIYFSAGLHGVLVLGAKSFRALRTPRVKLPRWLSGYGRIALISGVVGWTAALVLLVLVPLIVVPEKDSAMGAAADADWR